MAVTQMYNDTGSSGAASVFLKRYALLRDLDGDGKLDLAGDGKGSFAPVVIFAASSPGGIVVADFDQDGKDDFAVNNEPEPEPHALRRRPARPHRRRPRRRREDRPRRRVDR